MGVRKFKRNAKGQFARYKSGAASRKAERKKLYGTKGNVTKKQRRNRQKAAATAIGLGTYLAGSIIINEINNHDLAGRVRQKYQTGSAGPRRSTAYNIRKDRENSAATRRARDMARARSRARAEANLRGRRV